MSRNSVLTVGGIVHLRLPTVGVHFKTILMDLKLRIHAG